VVATWVNGMGAAGYQGATLTMTDNAGRISSMTITGYTAEQMSGMDVSYGETGGHTYMYIK
ncbi:MAG TPA: hypothetical protein VJX94_11165, partial [Stellaceae bacterium]|nr:hypothetical protein [Stellaceae bacterium]